MKNKYILFVICVILIIVGASIALINNNNNNLVENATTNNIKENMTDINSTNTEKNNSSIDKIEKNTEVRSNQIGNESNKQNISQTFSAEDAQKTVQKYVSFDNEVNLGNPRYKDKDFGWLVPARDKYTGKFAGSVYVYSSQGPFIHGPETFKEYKEIISKKK